jgi:serine/threonine-protein kinase RIO1
MLFIETIHDWESWGKVFQSIEAFRPIIREIFIKEHVSGYESISNLTPGTNAVFRAGRYVVKIFAPMESGLQTNLDYDTELSAMQRAIKSGVNAPRVIAASEIQDRYLFKYIIMDFIDGREAGPLIKSYTTQQKIYFARKLKDIAQKLNVQPKEAFDSNFLKERVLKNFRWSKYCDTVKQQVAAVVNQYDLSGSVYVHGDLTAQNVMIGRNDEIYIIDFADSVIAPVEYEYLPIAFDLFDFDMELIHEYFKEFTHRELVEKLFSGMLLHDFGGCIAENVWNTLSGRSIMEFTNIYDLKEMLYMRFKHT